MNSALVAMLGAFLAGFAVFSIVWYVLCAIANMKLFQKAGEAGWKAWIPFLNTYVSYSICWEGRFFWIWVACYAVNLFASGRDNALLSVISAAAVIATTAIGAMKALRLSKAFGHSYGYGIGLFILEPIFTMILGFGSSQYQGKPASIKD